MKNWNWKELKDTIGFDIFKRDYIRLFKKYHSDRLKERAGYRDPRIHNDSKCEEESILNYLNTNLLGYGVIVNETLKNIEFDPTTKDGYETMMEYVLNNQWFWNYVLLPKIIEVIKYTSSKGSVKENIVKDKLTKHFGNRFKVDVIGDLGNLTDMVEGIDMIIKNDRKSYLAQIKSCKSILLTDDVYKIEYAGINKLYERSDYFIFVMDDKVHVFDNKLIEKNDGGYMANKEALKIIL
jgi:hypothetical protein